MIKVNDDFVIVVDEYNYCVARNKPVIDKKTGKTRYNTEAYYRDLEGALQYIMKESIRKSLKNDDEMIDISTAVERIFQVKKELTELFRKVES